MFFIYSNDLFLLNKQLKKVIDKINNQDQETEINTYSWIEDDGQKILDDILTPSFFVDKKTILVKDAYFLSEKKPETSWVKNDKKIIEQILEKKELINNVIFTLNEGKISQKLKLTKKFETIGKILAVNEPTYDQMVNFILKKIQDKNKEIDQKTIELLLNLVPNEMQIINNELTKLLNLESKIIDEKIVLENVSHYFSSDVYRLSEYFQTNQINLFIIEFRNYLASSNDLIRLIYLLNTNLTFARDCLLLRKNGKDEKTIANLLNSHPYRVKMALSKNNLTISQLNDKILVLYDLNKQVVSGSIDAAINAELVLVKNMSGIKE